MARQDGRLEAGQRLNGAISARAWNRALDAADIVMGDRYGVGGQGASVGIKPYTWTWCKANATVPRWGILSIVGLQIVPTSTESDTATRSFQDCPVLVGDNSTLPSAWCVAVEPIEGGTIGRVAVSGVVQIKSTDIQRAEGACVLWKDSEWALIRIDARVVRLGSISSTWEKGQTATVTLQNGDGTGIVAAPPPTFAAKNFFSKVTVESGTKRVACAKVDDTWILIAAEC